MNEEYKREESQDEEEQLLVVPFEDSQHDFFNGIVETVKLIFMDPTHFFRNYRMDGGGSLGKPILFALVMGWISAIAGMIWDRIFGNTLIQLLQKYVPELEEYDQFGQSAMPQVFEIIIGLIAATVGIVVGLFIAAGIYHLFLMIMKANNKRFETTFCVVAYASVSSLAGVIPLIGGLISAVYGIVLNVIGIKEAHRTETGKALFAVLGPLLLCCLCCAIFAFILVSSGVMAGLANQ